MTRTYFGDKAELVKIRERRNAEIRAWGKEVLAQADRALIGDYESDWDIFVDEGADLDESDQALLEQEPEVEVEPVTEVETVTEDDDDSTTPEVEPELPTTEVETPKVEEPVKEAAPKGGKATSKGSNTAK